MHDLVIRNGQIIDGTGAERYRADIAIDGKTISAIGSDVGAGKREIDAAGLLVTPGFVDIHTHYDGQATWDSTLAPSIYHGVTTVVMGNCGVGFAPVKADQREWLISLMEGVEDIPGSILAEGVDWQWETFPEYLDLLDTKPLSIDIAAQLPHAALRTYVMGRRGGQHEERPSAEEIQTMATLAEEAIEAGALGFTTSRTINHKSSSGEYTPSLTAQADELLGIAEGVGRSGKGVLQLISDFEVHDEEFALIEQMAKRSGRPLSLSLNQIPEKADEWQHTLKSISAANQAGAQITAQVAPRPVGVLFSLQSTYHPFVMCPSFQKLNGLDLTTLVSRLQEPALRQTLFEEWDTHKFSGLEHVFILSDPPEYEPSPDSSIAAIAQARGCSAPELALDTMLENGGTGMLYYPALNFAEGNSDVSAQLLAHPHTVPGLGDGGAHVSFICDASFPTYLLTHWARDRQCGSTFSLEELVKAQSKDTAEVVGLHDRGVLKPGMKADINVIDFAALRIEKPHIVKDLPAGGHRLMQRADGYVATIVSGDEVITNGEVTGKVPGKLVRGHQLNPLEEIAS